MTCFGGDLGDRRAALLPDYVEEHPAAESVVIIVLRVLHEHQTE